MDSAPKDGTDILICTPGGNSDHYYVVAWNPDLRPPQWQCRWSWDMRLSEEFLANCHIPPMWMDLPLHPGSLSA